MNDNSQGNIFWLGGERGKNNYIHYQIDPFLLQD